MGENSKTKSLKRTPLPSKHLPETPKNGKCMKTKLKERSRRNLFPDSKWVQFFNN